MRVTSEIWVGAYLRSVQGQGAFASLLDRGAKEAGAIFIILNRMDGSFDLYGPAPQMFFDTDRPNDRKFQELISLSAEAEISEKIAREKSFDTDIWIVEIEDREGRHFLDIVTDDEL